MTRLRPCGGLKWHFAYIDAHFLLGRLPLNSPSPEIGKGLGSFKAAIDALKLPKP